MTDFATDGFLSDEILRYESQHIDTLTNWTWLKASIELPILQSGRYGSIGLNQACFFWHLCWCVK